MINYMRPEQRCNIFIDVERFSHLSVSKVRGNLFLSMTEITYNFHSAETICDALRDVIPFAQFKKRENIIGGRSLLVKSQALACNFTKSNTTS